MASGRGVWRNAIASAAFGLAFALCGCDEELPPPPPIAPVPDYPFEQRLIDVQGRELNATIVGREGNSIILTKPNDPKRYRYQIDQLVEPAPDFCRRFPQRQWYPPSPYELSARAELKRIDARIDDARSEIEKIVNAPSRAEAYRRQITALEKEKAKLKATLEKRLSEERRD